VGAAQCAPVEAKVSIRSRRRGREKRGEEEAPARDALFQSAPDAEAGRNYAARSAAIRLRSFNPLPTQRPGETRNLDQVRVVLAVSIRSRRRGREKLLIRRKPSTCIPFQSAPDAEAGRNFPIPARRRAELQFQSAPDAEAGRNPLPTVLSTVSGCFNPLPTQRPGETPQSPVRF